MSIICAIPLDPLLQLMKDSWPSFYPNYAYHSGAIKKTGIIQHQSLQSNNQQTR